MIKKLLSTSANERPSVKEILSKNIIYKEIAN